MDKVHVAWISGKNKVMHRIMHYSRDPTELYPSPVNIRLYQGFRENYMTVDSKVLKIHAQYLHLLFPS